MLKPRDDIVVQSVEDEALLLDMSSNKIHQLNAAATLVWEQVSAGSSVEVVERALVDQYDIDPSTVHSDVAVILQQFRDAALLIETP